MKERSECFAAAPAQAAPSLVENCIAPIRPPDEWKLIEIEQRADRLVRGHPTHRTAWDGSKIVLSIPCGCLQCRVFEDLTALIALARRIRCAP